MKLTKEELREILARVEEASGGVLHWLDIPAYIRKDNGEALLEIITERIKKQSNGEQ
jgi:hypothetical protein